MSLDRSTALRWLGWTNAVILILLGIGVVGC